MNYDVEHTAELQRILAIPRRDPRALGARLVGPLSKRLRLPGAKATMELFPEQALALAECHDLKGGMLPLPVGAGKTLLSMLLPVVLPCERPLLVVPAKHTDRLRPERGKTQMEFAKLQEEWQHHPNLQIVSYELISRRPDLLTELAPDLIIADEAHRLKNPKAAVTKRIRKYGAEYNKHHSTPLVFLPMSGTFTSRSFKDFWHLQQWALPETLCTLPRRWVELQSWCEAMDSKVEYRRPLGALEVFGAGLEEARRGYGRFLRHTPGVISKETQGCAASLQVTVREVKHPVIEEVSQKMRETWETPAGDPFSEAPQLWAHQREVGNGFWYEWKDKPPEEWLDARRTYHSWVRQTLHGSRKFDSALQLTKAYPDRPELVHWRRVKPTFKPVTVARWFTYDVLDKAEVWARKTEGLVWVGHKEAGFELSKRSGIPYFGSQGRTNGGRGMSIMEYRGPAVVSANAVSDGFNLQAWSNNLVLNCEPTGLKWEQVIGRTHRSGQLADNVTFEVLCYTKEQTGGFRQALEDARRTHGVLHPQKLCLADVDFICK